MKKYKKIQKDADQMIKDIYNDVYIAISSLINIPRTTEEDTPHIVWKHFASKEEAIIEIGKDIGRHDPISIFNYSSDEVCKAVQLALSTTAKRENFGSRIANYVFYGEDEYMKFTFDHEWPECGKKIFHNDVPEPIICNAIRISVFITKFVDRYGAYSYRVDVHQLHPIGKKRKERA